ncbi:hypothetical protein AC249_AIPGENE28881 [Exaiptasia diaphana]|nr:hypothetical protein AC249_AIPGENE28881 [Exaiptasia diaphana]
MGKCLSCFRASAKDSDFDFHISPVVVKEPKPKTWSQQVEADLSKLATPDVTEKSLKQLYCNQPKKESTTSLPRPVVNVNISAGESLSDSRSTLSSFFDHTCDDWSPKVTEVIKNATTDLQNKSDEDVTSSTSEVKQEIQEPKLIPVDEPTKQVDSAISIDSSNWDDSVTSSNDLGEASKLLQEIDTTTDDESSAQSVDESLNTKSNKVEDLAATESQPNDSFSSLFDEEESKLLQDILKEDQERQEMDATEPQPKDDSFSSLFDEEESKLLQEILKEDQQRQEMNAAAEDEIELTADLCLLGTSIRKDPNWRPNADVPDDADADGLEEVDDDSETSEDSSSSDMDSVDTRPIDGRDMIQDIVIDDQQRVGLSATPDDDTDLPIARPMPAGVFHGRGDAHIDDQRDSNTVMIENILRDYRLRDRIETPVEGDIEAGLATCRPLPPGVVNEGEFCNNDARFEEDTDDSFDIEDYMSTSFESEQEADGFKLERQNSGVRFHVSDNNETLEASGDAAFASELEDEISSPKAGRSRPDQGHDSFSSRPEMTKQEDVQEPGRSRPNYTQDSLSSSPQITKQEGVQEFQLLQRRPKSRMGFHADEGSNSRQLEAAIEEAAEELVEADRLIDEIDAISSPKHTRRRPYQGQDSLQNLPEMTKRDEVQEFPDQRPKSGMRFHGNDGNSQRPKKANERAALASELDEADQLLNEIDSISSPKPRRRLSHQKQGALSSRPEMTKREDVQVPVSSQRNAGDPIAICYDEEESKVIEDILEATAGEDEAVESTMRTSIKMSEEANVPTALVSDNRIPHVAAENEASEAALTSSQITGLQELRPVTRQHSLQRPQTRRGRAEGPEVGGKDQDRKYDQGIRPKTRRGRSETRDHSRPKTRRGRTEGQELGEPDRRRNDVDEIRPRTRRGRLEMIENSTPRPKTRRRRTEGQGLSGVNTSVNGRHGDTPMVSYDEEESNLMDEILREQEAKLRDDESLMDEIVATAELSILGSAGKQ